ncbi:MAG TPA: N-acetyl-gamma-glutamyl-phosphate reductase [Dissulfurispiraceae bacterium]|nr:N-acetyl-gamma-glutamyl-phosphate reductase [Dissulfurispiraceae bacterium]
MVKVAICGGSGYTGSELLRILSGHPGVVITTVTSGKSAGKRVTDLFPHLVKYNSLVYEPMEKEMLLSKADLFFMALPHAASQEAVSFFHQRGKKVIDLSADFRLSDPDVYEEWYKTPHHHPDTLKKAAYGLPELYRKAIRKSRLIANPGCYPTSAILALNPALKEGLIDPGSIIVDSKSGVSGAGRKSDVAVSFCEVNDGFKAYGVGVHRHTPEIEQILSDIAGRKILIDFTPHLVPMDRGIVTTTYARLTKKISTVKMIELYNRKYAKEPFVRILEEGFYPNAKHVRGSNYCLIGLRINERTNTLVAVSSIDNLVKGASGQAVQNMNIMLGLEETAALEGLALCP